MVSGGLCTRIIARGKEKDLKLFLNEIENKNKNIKRLKISKEEIIIETWDFHNIEYVEELSKHFHNIEFYEIVYDLFQDKSHWFLGTTMAKDGLLYHCYRWSSYNHPKLYRKKDEKVLEVAFNYMLETKHETPINLELIKSEEKNLKQES